MKEMKTVVLSNDGKETDIVGSVTLDKKAERLLATGNYIIAPEIYVKEGKSIGLRCLSILFHKKYKWHEI